MSPMLIYIHAALTNFEYSRFASLHFPENASNKTILFLRNASNGGSIGESATTFLSAGSSQPLKVAFLINFVIFRSELKYPFIFRTPYVSLYCWICPLISSYSSFVSSFCRSSSVPIPTCSRSQLFTFSASTRYIHSGPLQKSRNAW